MNDYFCVNIVQRLKRIADAMEQRNKEIEEKYNIALAALHRISNMAPGECETSDDDVHYYSDTCGTCEEMLGIAREAITKVRVKP